MKPKICEILGVELHEIFEFTMDGRLPSQYKVDEITDEFHNCIGYDLEKYSTSLWQWRIADTLDLIEMIEHPEKIKHGRWTKQNIEHIKAIKQLFCDTSYIQRYPACHDGEYSYEAFDTNEKFIGGITAKEDLFPQLRIYDRIRLSDILEEVGNEPL